MLTDNIIVIHYLNQPWEIAIVDGLVSVGLLTLAGLLIIHTLRFYLPTGKQYINIFSKCLILAVIWVLLIKVILHFFYGQNAAYSKLLYESLPVRFSIGFLLLGCFTMIGILWFSQQEQKESETRKQDAEKLAKEAELFKLRQQLQPHFLFNSLNSINALIGTRPEEARRMVQQLSEFLRGTIKKEDTDWISLKEELQYLELYLNIEKVRFGNRLSTAFQIDKESTELKIPALLLQPIVENAIKFGLYDTTGQTEIILSAKKEGGHLLIAVTNPFDPATASPIHGTGFGLKSIQRRLYLLFGRKDLLTSTAKDNTFTSIIKIPQTQNHE
ncbi:MAG: histidine kinase [Chitinophagaceae bacterium]|nr:histidine kinase [Chitinophagaceae bacterium]